MAKFTKAFKLIKCPYFFSFIGRKGYSVRK
jgi:hypothetical protein